MALYRVLYICTLIWGFTSVAQTEVIDVSMDTLYLENPKIAFIIDSSDQLSIDKVKKADDWKTSKSSIINLGLVNKPVWFKICVQNNTSSTKKIFLTLKHSLLDTVSLYQTKNDKVVWFMEQGELYPLNQKIYDSKSIVFPVNITNQEAEVIYLKVKTAGSVFMPILISDEASLFKYENHEMIIYGVFYGFMFIIFLYNLIFYFSYKEPIHLLYNLYLITFVFGISFFNGTASTLYIFESDRSILNYILPKICIISVPISAWFYYNLLDIKTQKKWLMYLFRFTIISSFFLLAFSLLISYRLNTIISASLYLFIPLLIIVIGIYCWFKGNSTAKYTTIANSFFLVSVSITSLKVLGVLSGSGISPHILEIGLTLEVVLITFALSDKIKLKKRTLEKTHHEIMQDFSKIGKRSMEQNIFLESNVSSSTQEILEKNHELENLSHTIKSQNEKLKKYNENLEGLIAERTQQILINNKELKTKTDRLEQFTYIASNNLKIPVHNIDAMISNLNVKNIGMDNLEFFQIMQKTSKQLKNTIDDLNTIIKNDIDIDISFQYISLNKIVQDTKDKLYVQILESNCQIDTSFTIEHIKGFEPYMSSVFYNLINNSIKYRSMLRPLKIWIDSHRHDEEIIITIKDNGIGIAENQLQNVFKLFYRANKETEGKGMGLFIVKSQIEQLGGRIEVISKLGKETVFIIFLPA